MSSADLVQGLDSETLLKLAILARLFDESSCEPSPQLFEFLRSLVDKNVWEALHGGYQNHKAKICCWMLLHTLLTFC